MDDSLRYNLLKRLADNPHLSQRELAKELGISLPALLNAGKAGPAKQDLT